MIETKTKGIKKNGYNKTNLGLIPVDWEMQPIKSVGKVITGSTPSTKEESYYDGEYLFATPADLSSVKYVEKTEKHLTKAGFETGRVVPRNSVLFVSIGSTIGKTGIAQEDLITNQQINSIKTNDLCSDEYLFYQLTYLSERIKLLAGKQAVPILNKSNFESIRIPLPPLQEQLNIAKVLSRWDEAISKVQKLIKGKKFYKKGLMQRLLSGKVRFPEFEGEEWVEVKLGDIAEVISSNLDKKIKEGQEDVRLCNYMDVYDNAVIDSSIPFMESTASEREIEKYTLKEDDVIITKDSETPDDIANAAVVKNLESRVLCGYHLAIIRPNKEKVLGDFLTKQIMTFAYRKQFFQRANGATRYGLRISDIESAKFQIPSLKEQEKISSLINCVDKEINILIEEKKAFEKQKKGLMQQLLTGKIRIN